MRREYATAGRMSAGGRGQAAFELALALEGETSPLAVQDRFQRYIENHGYTSAVCLAVDPTRPLAMTDVLISTRPSAWLECYLAEGHIAADPVLAALGQTQAPFAWSDVVAPGALEPPARQVMGLAAKYGMEDGFAIPIGDARHITGLVSLAGPRRHLGRADRAMLSMAAIYVHQRLVTLRRERIASAVTLTDRELEIVRWIAAGKSDWQIGQILSISAKTVNYHVENVKRKYGVASRIQAVVAALNQGGLAH